MEQPLEEPLKGARKGTLKIRRSQVYQSKVAFERQRAAKGPSAVERQAFGFGV